MKKVPLHLMLQLFLNGLRFRYLRRSGRPGRVQAMSLEITHRCVARCLMCNIWRIPNDVPDLSMSTWMGLLSSHQLSDLRELDITGGEPFLREDLVELVRAAVGLKERNLRKLRSVAVTTNGLLTDAVLEGVEALLPALTEKGVDLVMVCALDGVGDIHSRIRNFKDAWLRVDETIQGLRRLRETHPELVVGLKTTVIPDNVDELDRIAGYAASNSLFTIISPCIITEGRYLNVDRAGDLRFTQEHVAKMIRFFRSRKFQWSFHAQALAEYYERGVMKKPCTCGFNYFFVRSTGEVLPCPLLNRSVGNIREQSLEEMLESPAACLIRRGVGRFPRCRSCTEPGLERYALPYEGFAYFQLLMKEGMTRGLDLHAHMGLDKYMDDLRPSWARSFHRMGVL
jgi:MoaA/NifB/PqqE/SkfB family radical SAM enzyme